MNISSAPVLKFRLGETVFEVPCPSMKLVIDATNLESDTETPYERLLRIRKQISMLSGLEESVLDTMTFHQANTILTAIMALVYGKNPYDMVALLNMTHAHDIWKDTAAKEFFDGDIARLEEAIAQFNAQKKQSSEESPATPSSEPVGS